MFIKTKKQKCKKCEYQWVSRIPDPKSCPDCKHRIAYGKKHTR